MNPNRLNNSYFNRHYNRRVGIYLTDELNLAKENERLAGNYVQISSNMKNPSNKYVNSLKHSYPYVLKKVRVNNEVFTKVLVGPFDEKIELK